MSSESLNGHEDINDMEEYEDINDVEEYLEQAGEELLDDEGDIILSKSNEDCGNDMNLEEKCQSWSIPNSITYNSPIEPSVGMIFDDLEDAKTCYTAYARRNGFSIRKFHTQLSRKDKSLIGVQYACSREGYRCGNYKKKRKNEPKKSETRIGCKAKLVLSKDNGQWIVKRFVTEHNHELCSPKSTLLLRGHRKITPTQRSLIDVMNNAGIPTRRIMQVLDQQNCGDSNVGYLSMDVQNYLGSKRRELLKQGDAQTMLNYFVKCQSQNPGFVYAVEANMGNSMGNCFWADARSRLAYQCFGDVVTFDATYLTNRYKMPFVPFTGVNHHHQSTMFGCALLVNETIDSYIWLLRTWLETMDGRAPSVIITDGDEAMAKAIKEVLPTTTHHLCMWHILQKFPERLAHVYNKHPPFQEEFHKCIHNTMTIEEFEDSWDNIVHKYELTDNEWLKGVYMMREKWVPAYLRNTFCAGMSTTQRSESMNKFFKGFVQSSTMVSEFVYQYEKALDARYLKEKEKDVKTRNSSPVLKTCYKIEKDAAKLYTRKMFLLFQNELFSSQKLKAMKFYAEGTKKTYKVIPQGKEGPVYEVVLDIPEIRATCSCRMFEFVGILCKHILATLVKKSLVDSLPQHYIMGRWTIDAKCGLLSENRDDMVQESFEECSSTMMKNSLMMELLKVVEEGKRSKKKYNYLKLAMQNVYSELLKMEDETDDSEKHVSQESAQVINDNNGVLLSNLNFTLSDPPHVASRGRPKSLRQKHPIENQAGKSKRKCSICKQTGHTRTRCPSKDQARI